MSNKIFVLQKDLPHLKKGAEFIFDGVGDYECHATYKNEAEGYVLESYHQDYVINNPEWFLPKKEEKIEVTDIRGIANDEHGLFIEFNTRPTPEKYQAVKNAIEFVLNGDKERKQPHPHEENLREMFYQRNVQNPYSNESQSHCAYEKGFEECWKHFFKGKLFTEKEMLEAEENAFNESRKTHPMVGFKYDTFSDYKNTQK